MGWLSGWSNRIPITVRASDIKGDLSGFPLMIKLSASAGKNNANILKALPALFEMRDIPGWSFKENKCYASYTPNTRFEKPTSTSVRMYTTDSTLGGAYMWCTVRKELIIPGCQIECNWSVSANSASALTRIFIKDGKFERWHGAHFPYEDYWALLGSGLKQQIEAVYNSISAHTTKATINLPGILSDYVTVLFFVTDGSSSYSYDVRCNWMRFLDENDTVLFNVDLSGDFVQELSGTYQDYAKVGDPDSDNDNIGKIAVTLSDGETQLPVEIESWDFANQEIILWTKADLSNSIDSTLYLYYDKDHVENTDYVYESSPIVRSTADLLNENFNSISGWTDYDSGDGISRLTIEGGTFEFFSGFSPSSGDTAYRGRQYDSSTCADREVIEVRLAHRRLGNHTDNDCFNMYFRNELMALLVSLGSDGLYVWKDDAAWHRICAYPYPLSSWQTWVFDLNATSTSSGTLDVYLNGKKVAAAEEVYGDLGETYGPGHIFLRQEGYTTANQRTNVDYIKVGTDIIKRNVWDDDFISVWHMDKYMTEAQDSSHGVQIAYNNIDNTNTVTGTLGRALQLNGSDEWLWMDAGNPSSFNIGKTSGDQLTLEALVNPDRIKNYVLGNAKSNSTYGYYSLFFSPSAEPQFGFECSTGTVNYVPPSGVVTTGTEHYVAVRHEYGDSSKFGLMWDGVMQTGGSWSKTGDELVSTTNTNFQIGHWYGTPGTNDAYTFDGSIDEVRFSNILRSDAWLEATCSGHFDNLITYGTLERSPGSSPNTIYCIYDNPIYNVSTSGIEVYNLDISTDYYIAYATISGATSVAKSKGKLLVGTTTNGILYIPTTVISGTNIYAPQNFTSNLSTWKQYPAITNNYVKDITACEDYVCIVTVSGVDHFNLGSSQSYDHSSGLTATAEKCFQTCRGRFYYTAGTKIVTIYTHQCDWTESTVGYEYDSTLSGTLLPPESEINDIYVVESQGKPNLIFVATTSGVALIEEKPGNEANAQYKHYFVED